MLQDAPARVTVSAAASSVDSGWVEVSAHPTLLEKILDVINEVSEMSFDELLDRAYTEAGLPDMARMQLPSALSEKTKKRVIKMSPEEFGDILSRAIWGIMTRCLMWQLLCEHTSEIPDCS